jgi:hypothetical protein
MIESWGTLQMVRHVRCSTCLMQTLPVMQEIFTSGWQQMALIHSVLTPHHTLAGPSFAVSYSLPPSLCMKFEFMFLCLIIPGPYAPDPRIKVMLRPLIKHLKQLWIGVEVYDYYKKQKFNLRAAYLWSIHDFKAYDVFARWSIHEELTCLICGSDTDCFRLTHGGKISYFDCHRRWLP